MYVISIDDLLANVNVKHLICMFSAYDNLFSKHKE